MVTTTKSPVLALVLALGAASCVPGGADPDATADLPAADLPGEVPEDVRPRPEVPEAFALTDLAANAPPGVAWQSPPEGTVVLAGQPVELVATVSDDDTPAASIAVSVALPAGAPPLAVPAAPDADGRVAFTIDGLEPGKNVIVLTAHDRFGATAEAALTLLANRVPGAPVVGIEPASPRTDDDLVASVLAPAEDPDSGPVPLEQHAFAWLVDGQPADGLSGATVPANRTKAGERWTVVVTAGDGMATGAAGAATVTIDPSPPGAPVVALDPAAPTVASTVRCVVATPAVDPDGDEPSYLVRWTLDGQVVEDAGTGTTLPLADRSQGAWKPLLPVKVGAVIGCRVNATDGLLAGPMAEATVPLAAFDPCPDDGGACPAGTACAATDTVEAACPCAPGHAPTSGAECVDVDECADGSAACPAHSRCVNEAGGYACPCDAGWEKDPAGGGGCADADECAAGTHACDPRSDCANTAGAYACPCKAGYRGDGLLPDGCADVDECALGLGVCDAVSRCANTDGGYACPCIEGYEADEAGGCRDADECAAGTAGCDANADCLNGPGSWTCLCREGWAGDGTACEDVDECALGLHGCDGHATCLNGPGTYDCECDPGWTGDGATCEDLDECAADPPPCDPHASCENTTGGYACVCAPGFAGDGVGPGGCADVDECATGQGVCPPDADCANVDGSWTCPCRDGFVADGLGCADVDECANGTASCDPAAACANTAGSYTCTCKPGWTGDGRHCRPA